ncbi:MAG: VIT1/CCC1 transporter family protein [Candidatus Rokubacteria bacterium]|nr:VIT1/CCC1 transporter family protein [Candidatus Rokubacteria bacterium]
MEAIRGRREAIERKSQIREVAFGTQDGLVSTLGFVAGLHGAVADNWLVLLGGLVQMVAGAFSMAAGAYLATQAERQVVQRAVRAETERFEEAPYLAQEALLGALEEEGLARDKAYRIVKLFTDERHAFLKTFREKVLGVGSVEGPLPLWAATLMGVSFAVGSFVPLLPYFIFAEYTALWVAIGATSLALFGIGVAKAALAAISWWRSGAEFFLVAMGAAGIGYLVGWLLPL